jgi:predicted aminopeptidase
MKRFLYIAALACALLPAACSPGYVLRAGLEEARILSRRRPIDRVIEDPTTSGDTRNKLRLVLQARDFAEHALGLNAGESYTTYSYVDSDTLLLVVSAAHKDRFEAYTWWFPIVGNVPYKGFFHFDDAFAEAARLDAAGYDTYVRPSGAFSTLGWFNDPLLNTILRYDEISLVSTVIHELLHNTVYFPSQIAFNETFANFVGDRGVVEFFCARDGETSPRCTLARDAWLDNLRYAAFLSSLVRELESIYGRKDLDRAAKLSQRERTFTAAQQRWVSEVEPAMRTNSFRGFLRRPLNNATLIGTRLYYDRLNLFEAVLQHMGGNFEAAVNAVIAAASARPNDPYGATEALLSSPTER